MKFTTNTLAAVAILAGVSVSSAQQAPHRRHDVSGKRLGLRALNEELQADESMSMSFPLVGEIDQNFGTGTGGGKSGKAFAKVNVPTSPFSTNICAGQTARFLEQTGLDMVTLTCAEAAGEGPLGRVAPQTGGVSEEELYYISYVVK